MKREGMPTQRLEGKRVEERVGEGERERERTQVGEKEKEKALWLLLLYVFASPGPALCKLGLARTAVCST